MRITYHKKFTKAFTKLPPVVQKKFYERLRLFALNPVHPILHNHKVDAAYPNWRSINITGDYRALYEPQDASHIEFMKIGTHSELYG